MSFEKYSNFSSFCIINASERIVLVNQFCDFQRRFDPDSYANIGLKIFKKLKIFTGFVCLSNLSLHHEIKLPVVIVSFLRHEGYILKLSTLNEPSVGPSKISVIRDIFQKMVCSSLLYFGYQVMKALIYEFLLPYPKHKKYSKDCNV